MGERVPDPDRKEVDRITRVMMIEWERAEGEPVNVSYIATFVDMARAVLRELGTTPQRHDLTFHPDDANGLMNWTCSCGLQESAPSAQIATDAAFAHSRDARRRAGLR